MGMAQARAILLLVSLLVAAGVPATTLAGPLDHGPLADFLTIFRQQSIPKQVVL